jgi:hypothetical protein
LLKHQMKSYSAFLSAWRAVAWNEATMLAKSWNISQQSDGSTSRELGNTCWCWCWYRFISASPALNVAELHWSENQCPWVSGAIVRCLQYRILSFTVIRFKLYSSCP